MQYLLRLVEGLRVAGLVDSHVFGVEERVRAQELPQSHGPAGAADSQAASKAGSKAA